MKIIVDTGPLVAYLNSREPQHAWMKGIFADQAPPFYTCEAVLTEVFFLVERSSTAIAAMQSLVRRHLVRVDFSIQQEHESIFKLMSRFASVPMSFADACLVRMSETIKASRVLTLDSDFRIYRRNGREVVPTLMP